MRRFTRLTNAFSKKVENHAASVAPHFLHYSLARAHKSLKNPYPQTPAMAAGVDITPGRCGRSRRCWIDERQGTVVDADGWSHYDSTPNARRHRRAGRGSG